MDIMHKIRNLFTKSDVKSTQSKLYEPLNYLGVSFVEISKNTIDANKKIDKHIENLVKKLPRMTKEELEKERKSVMKSMTSEGYENLHALFPQDLYSFIKGKLQKYLDEIESELKKHN